MIRDPKNLTVLVVDDVQENIDILLETLDGECEVAVALDGKSALDVVAEAKPDLILLDIMMPEMDGYEVCRRLKESPDTAEIPVIFITALDSIDDESRGLALGAIDYITKPFNPSVVKARVRNHLALCEASRLRQDVEHIMRHDLKNPLMVIIGAPELIMMTETLSQQSVELLEQVEEAGRKLLTMINLSLDTYKMEQKQYKVTPVNVNLVILLKKVMGEQNYMVKLKNLDLRMRLDGKPVKPTDRFEVSGEELLCYNMFSNLLKNALEASPAAATITVNLETLLPRRIITIHNHGTVPREIRGCFFEKYSTSGKNQGTGLGTYSAALIAETLGGEIAMETSKEKGTSIVVQLPSFSKKQSQFF